MRGVFVALLLLVGGFAYGQASRYAISFTNGGTATALVSSLSLNCGHIAQAYGGAAIGGGSAAVGRVVSCSASPVVVGALVNTVNGSLTSPGLVVPLTVASIIDQGQLPVTVGASVVAVSGLAVSASSVVTFGANVVNIAPVTVSTGSVRVDSSLVVTDAMTVWLSTFILSMVFLFTVLGLKFGRTR